MTPDLWPLRTWPWLTDLSPAARWAWIAWHAYAIAHGRPAGTVDGHSADVWARRLDVSKADWHAMVTAAMTAGAVRSVHVEGRSASRIIFADHASAIDPSAERMRRARETVAAPTFRRTDAAQVIAVLRAAGVRCSRTFAQAVRMSLHELAAVSDDPVALLLEEAGREASRRSGSVLPSAPPIGWLRGIVAARCGTAAALRATSRP